MRRAFLIAASFVSTAAIAQPLSILTPDDIKKLCVAESGGEGTSKGNELFRACREKIMSDPRTLVLSGVLVDESTKRMLADALRATFAHRKP